MRDERDPEHPEPGPLPPGQTRDGLIAEVERALRVVPHGASVVVAVSGGPDSTALAFLAAEARPDLVLGLAHVRHGLRDDRADVAAVTEHSSFLGVPLHVAEVVVRHTGEGMEAEARAQRYAALRRLARDAGAGWVLVGHTADDQAETLLIRLARGTGITGLGGMAPVRGDLLRPLLRLRRNDVHRFVVHEGLPTVDDPTNSDPAIRRTVARHQVLPALEALGPDPVGALGRLADLARDDARRLDADATSLAGKLLVRYGPALALPVDDTLAEDPAIGRRLVRALVLEARGGGDPPSAAEVARILTLGSGAGVDLPGVRVTCGGGWFAAAPAETVEAVRPEPVVLEVPGATPWTAADLYVVATVEGTPTGPHDPQLALDLAELWQPPDVDVHPSLVPPGGDPELGQIVLGDLGGRREDRPRLRLRGRAPGDRVLTAAGTRKLQDVFVDAGVPRVLRDFVPVLVLDRPDQEDRVLWVPGLVADAEAVDAGRRHAQLHLAISATTELARPDYPAATRRPS